MSRDDHPHSPSDRDPRPSACALRGTTALRAACTERELRVAVDAFLGDLTGFLKEQGCGLIGHIKGMLEAGEKGHLFFSVTSFEEEVRYKGGLTGDLTRVGFTLNVIVYGVDREEIEPAVLQGLERHLGEVIKVKGQR